MAITDDQVAALRAHLGEDTERYRRLYDGLDREARRGYAALVTAAFVTAADHRFGQGSGGDEVIRFVADARARYGDVGGEVNPEAAERLVRAVYEEVDIDDIDAETMGRAQLVMLTALVADERYDGESLDAFLAKARSLADEWTG